MNASVLARLVFMVKEKEYCYCGAEGKAYWLGEILCQTHYAAKQRIKTKSFAGVS